MSRLINATAEFLSTWQGFVATFLGMIVGIVIGALFQFNDSFMFGFNLLLSIAAIMIGGIILVAGARSEAALHVKLDYLIESSKVANKAIGIEHKDVGEIEKERKALEAAARTDIGRMIEKEVAEEVTERLKEHPAPAET